jgi:hypothetical protein
MVLRLAYRWIGRLLILAGIINGGLGVDLVGNVPGHKIYDSVAGIMGALYLGLVWLHIFLEGRRL